MRKYRVDSFSDGSHITKYFPEQEAAREYASTEKRRGKIVFLLQEVVDGWYEVPEEI